METKSESKGVTAQKVTANKQRLLNRAIDYVEQLNDARLDYLNPCIKAASLNLALFDEVFLFYG